jgi:hypothetical protein
MPHDAAARHDHLLNSLTIVQLRTDLLQRRLARHTDLSAADRAWLDTSLGDIAQSVRALTTLMGASGGVLEISRSDAIVRG